MNVGLPTNNSYLAGLRAGVLLALFTISTSAFGLSQNNCDAFVTGSNTLSGVPTAGQPSFEFGGPGINGCSISDAATLTSVPPPNYPPDIVYTTSSAINAMTTDGDATLFTGIGIIYAYAEIDGYSGTPTAEASAKSTMWQRFELAPGQTAVYSYTVTFMGSTGTPDQPLSFLPTFTSGLYSTDITGKPLDNFSYVNVSTNNAIVLSNGQIITKRFEGKVTNMTNATVRYYLSSQSTNPTPLTVVVGSLQSATGASILSFSYNFRYKVKTDVKDDGHAH